MLINRLLKILPALALAILPLTALPFTPDKERILSYHSDIVVDTSSKLTVTETIRVNAMGVEIQRGIFRMIPLKRNLAGRTVNCKYEVVSVKKNGSAEKYKAKSENGHLAIYIGDEDVYLQPNVYEYEITYETWRQIGYFDDFDELYWNVTGNEWSFEIEKASAAIHLPEGAEVLQHACYTGFAGSTETNCSSDLSAPGTVTWTASELKENEGLTIAVGFTKGIVKQPRTPSWLETETFGKILGGIGIAFLALMYFLWSRHGKDHESPTVVPQFDIPDRLSPASIGYIASGSYKNNLLAAALVDMAVKGYIRIKEIPKTGLFGKTHYTIEKLKSEGDDLGIEEKGLFQGLFPGRSDSLNLTGEYNASVAAAVNIFMLGITGRSRSILSKGHNRGLTFLLFLAISAIYWTALYSSYQHFFDYSRLITGIILYAVMAVSFLVFISTGNSTAGWIWILPLLITAAGSYIWYQFDRTIDPFTICFLFLVAGVTILAVFNYLIRRPEPELLRVRSLIDGLKMYMGAAETQLIRFNNPPKMTPQIFEKYLPYAMVLGVDKIWGAKFESLLRQNATEYSHDWYSGNRDMHNFPGSIGDSLGSGLTQSLSSASTDNSSSGGSDGGGSSGGGGGGGGGGGW